MVTDELKKWVREWVAGWSKNTFYQRAEYKRTSSGTSSHNLPIVLDQNGKIDNSFINWTTAAEDVQDIAGAMVAGNTETDISVTYQDIDGTIDFVVNQTMVGEKIHAATAKTTPVDADTMPLIDSAAANVLKKVTWANVKGTLKTYMDTLYELAGSIATHAALTVTHGATGAIVGTTNSQTLTNKTLTTPIIGTVYGGSAANDDITIHGTSNATRASSFVYLQPSGGGVVIGTPEMSPSIRVLEVGDGGVVGAAAVRVSSTTDSSLVFHDENVADDEWILSHIVSNNSFRLAGWRTGVSGAVTEYLKVLLGGEVIVNGSGTSPALTGNMLAVYGSVAKATASRNAVATFGSSDTANQMQLRVQISGSATAAERAAAIQATEAGVSARPLLLNPDGGNVGLNGVGDPDAPLTIATSDSTTSNGDYQISLRSERTGINTVDSLIGGIEFVSNDTSLTAPGTTVAVIRAIARATHSATELSTAFQFLTTDGSSAMAEVLRIEDNGDVKIGTGTPATKLDVDGVVTATGINLGEDTLSYFDEGTWTPSIAFGGMSTGITYTTRTGTYTRIGDTVWLFGEIQLSSKGSATGAATVTGFPFTTSSQRFAADVVFSNMTGTYVQIEMYSTGTATSAQLAAKAAAATGVSNLTDTGCSNTSIFYFTFSYKV